MKKFIKAAIPDYLWTKLRLLRNRFSIANFNARQVNHVYAGHRLNVCIADPLGEGWYDHDAESWPEIDFLVKHQLKRGACVFDLGAHQAVIALVLGKTVGESGLVVAVEANTHNVKVALRNKEINNFKQVEIVHAAVADKPGTLIFNESLNGQVDDGLGRWGQVKVNAITIDQLAARYRTPNVLFIDVEGFECQVLQGAEATLGTRPDCFVEVHVGEKLKCFNGSVEKVISFFPKEKFDLYIAAQDQSQFIPWSWDSPVIKERFYLVALGNRREMRVNE